MKDNPTAIVSFNSPEFGNLRTIENDGVIEFCGKDVAQALGYKRTAAAVSAHCRGSVKRRPIVDNLGRTQEAAFITEPDLYRLITHSKLPNAQKFESWVFEEVLPSIRKHGGYLTPQKIEEVLTDPDTIIQLATTLKEEQARRKALEAENQVMQPKALFADAVAASHTSILVGELAKLLKQNGVEIGQNRLFRWLRENGYLMKTGSSYNMPTQRSMEQELFEVKETSITHSDGHITVQKTPKVTGKGQQYFINRFLTKGEVA